MGIMQKMFAPVNKKVFMLIQHIFWTGGKCLLMIELGI
jgi:hypothetical protein